MSIWFRDSAGNRSTVCQRGERFTRDEESFQGVYRSATWYRKALVSAGFTIEDSATATTFASSGAATRTPLAGYAHASPARPTSINGTAGCRAIRLTTSPVTMASRFGTSSVTT